MNKKNKAGSSACFVHTRARQQMNPWLTNVSAVCVYDEEAVRHCDSDKLEKEWPSKENLMQQF